jgi:hypothetical protein
MSIPALSDMYNISANPAVANYFGVFVGLARLEAIS